MISTSISIIFLLFYCRKKLKLINADYLKVAIPTGFFYSIANLLQKIGLLYTTPTQYAFLENLSCVTVPILMFILIKKKPSILIIISSVTCLLGAYILTGATFDIRRINIGDILCAAAGLLYGFNIAGTSAFSKKLDSSLYILIQFIVHEIIAAIYVLFFNDNYFYFEPWIVLYLIAVPLIFSVFCWIVRTNCMKHIDGSVIAIIMPFSSVLTGIFSLLIGMDRPSLNLILGAIICFAAIMLGSTEDILKSRKARRNKLI